jgi:hypothetical protein
MSTTQWRTMNMARRAPEVVAILNMTSYRRDGAAAELEREYGWREYGGKHFESTFTKFYQGVILPAKFGVDKRRVHLSDRLRNGELTREDALVALEAPPYAASQVRPDTDYVRKKLGFDEAEWAAIMGSPPRSHRDFPSDRRFALPISLVLRGARTARRLATGWVGRRRASATAQPADMSRTSGPSS